MDIFRTLGQLFGSFLGVVARIFLHPNSEPGGPGNEIDMPQQDGQIEEPQTPYAGASVMSRAEWDPPLVTDTPNMLSPGDAGNASLPRAIDTFQLFAQGAAESVVSDTEMQVGGTGGFAIGVGPGVSASFGMGVGVGAKGLRFSADVDLGYRYVEGASLTPPSLKIGVRQSPANIRVKCGWSQDPILKVNAQFVSAKVGSSKRLNGTVDIRDVAVVPFQVGGSIAYVNTYRCSGAVEWNQLVREIDWALQKTEALFH